MAAVHNYVNIFGPIRSGKTLVGRALNMHPELSVQQEPFFFYFKFCRNIFHRDILKDSYDYNQPIETDLCMQARQKALFIKHFQRIYFNRNDIVELKKWTKWQQKSAGNERAAKMVVFLDRLKAGNAQEVLGQLCAVLEKAYPKKSLRWLGFTEAWCDNFITPLLSMDKLAFKTVHIIRDPRAIIASRNAGTQINKYGGKYPLLFLIRHWRKSVAYSIVHKANPNYLLVRYEDLIASPDKWFRLICKHLGIIFSESLMHPESYLNGAGKRWRQNTNFERKAGFSDASLAVWKERLSAQEIMLIEYLCQEEMSYCGYLPTQNDSASVRMLASFTENNQEIVPWLRPYNLIMNESEVSLELIRKSLLDLPDTASKEMREYYFINNKVYQSLLQMRTNKKTKHN